ncbi:replication restart helicase PriA [Buchnera aphidicola]|uniref:Replication restart protein PriA n=1 Tax=Buchnera aphidicola subsp. Schizaphis graminum (strain Sg) TaxID=198804 RepID=PRIA_BUCAP|nr:primosomal protein N' [Buchnera aphidicola]Q8KA15.1 RecName: Full=Primosomal protein N'; AltName: Full=ATP-dependent helicase PriA [Buchnera aphidicola str. Sg (Schizaphis graminum)]AAM67681.1 primosomal protein n' [Buchnera aphidicola str. Sg (Schizaphis graminum)]AWI49822.1 primosomal protein N' [Buchnera aphidicola (Schizaphis graminum)]
MIIVKVVLPLPIRKYFKYFMPDSMCPIIGGRIVVPFRSKDIVGIVISFCNKKNISNLNLAFVKSCIDTESIYSDVVFSILIWLSRYYYFPIGSIFFSILPKYLKKICLIDNKNYKFAILRKTKYKDFKTFNLLFFCKKKSFIDKDLEKYTFFDFFLKKNFLQKSCKNYFYHENIPHIYQNYLIKKKFFLNKKIIFIINKILMKNCFTSWLITKNNFYLKVKFYLGLIKECLSKNLQILILVPFVKDIYQILFFLKKYFNVYIDIIHSQLNNEDYLKKWIRTKSGKNSIIIGTKNSVFFPFLKLGLIIVNQEHHLNYRNLDQCRYNVRDIAILRAYKQNIPIILDSDTPSLRTLYNILHKKCFYIKFIKNKKTFFLKNNVIDLRKERIKIGLSSTLINEIFNNIQKNYPVLLVLNKFSFVFFGLICRRCGKIEKCHICNDYFETKKYDNFLFCRNCLIKIKKPLFCYNCKNFSLIVFDFGIKKIKNSFKKIFPNINLFFLLSLKKNKTKKLKIQFFKFPISNACIIITTEKISQHYYFPYVRFIALTNVDHYFFSFHFCSIEHFLQFYFNLINLTGENKKLLKIFIQTSYPNNKFLLNLCSSDYFLFCRKILSLRKKYFLPPWNFQVIFYSSSKFFEKSFIFLECIQIILKKQSKRDNVSLWFVGPHPVFSLKDRKKCFYQLLIHSPSRTYLKKILKESINIVQCFSISQNVQWFLDIDIY